MKLTENQIVCLREMWHWRSGGFPHFWKPKTREKLEDLGLVAESKKKPGYYLLTDAGRNALKEASDD